MTLQGLWYKENLQNQQTITDLPFIFLRELGRYDKPLDD